ncbi:hypothetical protein L950_0221245 [Sphingobacterium sp. IITKGP-BTPF85]|nr:hypothetical protein L950_0221245 [Sphingobacterium sp. IITKGP-BTPF85]
MFNSEYLQVPTPIEDLWFIISKLGGALKLPLFFKEDFLKLDAHSHPAGREIKGNIISHGDCSCRWVSKIVFHKLC